MVRPKKMNFPRKLIQAALIVTCIFLSGSVSGLVSGTQITHPAVNAFTVPVSIQTYGNAWEGYLAFGLWDFPIVSEGFTLTPQAYVVVMTTNGQLLDLRSAKGQINPATWMATFAPVKYLGDDTIMYEGDPITSTHFWNLKSNQTLDFPNVYGHHDMIFNPKTGTFLTLWSSVRQIDGRNVLMDTIVELDSEGNVLWTWDTYSDGHFGLKDECRCNDTTVVDGQTVIDLTHANSLQWDFQSNTIYMNMRALDTFCKINKTTGQTVWCLGRRGDFKLLGPDGRHVPSLWYHGHDVQEVQPDVFSMFDNDFGNATNSTNPCPATFEETNAHSRMLEITVNEQNMTAWTSWSWTAPREDWSPYWGSMDRLPNGDWIAAFGSQSHYVPGSGITSPLPNSTGAVLVEVNQNGQVVRTYTFTYGWGIYRVVPIALHTTNDYDGNLHKNPFTIKLTTTNELSGPADIFYKINNGATQSVAADGQPYITAQGTNNTLEYWSVTSDGIAESPHNILTGIDLQNNSTSGISASTTTPTAPVQSISPNIASAAFEIQAVIAAAAIAVVAILLTKRSRRN